MSENFTRSNRDLEARIAQLKDPLDIQNFLAETPVTEVLRGAKPVPVAPSKVGTALRQRVQAPDGRWITVSADSWYGIDVLAEGVRKGQIVEDIL